MKSFTLSKKILSVLLAILLVFSVTLTAFADGEEPTINPEAYPKFADKNWGALYAHATLGGNSSQAWQRWGKDYTGLNAVTGMRYFFLPSTADDSRVEIYNNYDTPATIGSVTIEPYTSAFVPYKNGTAYNVSVNSKNYSFTVYKSDSEASVFVNDTRNSYVDVEGVTQNTDLYSFLIANKENSVKGSDCAIAGGSSVTDTTLKKIKGRGNTNWTQTDKKPFNLQFSDSMTIGHTKSKKFSFVSNAKDSTLLRNTIMYNLADEVGSPYAPDQSFVDFFVNGEYRGSYIACQKVDLGKSSLVSLKDTSDSVNTNFNFLVEVDVWNYKNDINFVSNKGYHVVLKTPDLEGYDGTDADMTEQYNYIKNTYQTLENALYSGNMTQLEQICDLQSLASQYLLQEFGKNCDGGYTSTYFTYNADEGKFYAAPLWDCDSDLGAVDCMREGCANSTCHYTGWVTRTATYRSDDRQNTVNPLGQAFKVTGLTSDGKTFEDIVKQCWTEKFLPKIDIILGDAPAGDGRLRSIDYYADSIKQASYNNYVMWGFMWYCGRFDAGLNTTYTRDYSGELSYLKDWTRARAGWLTTQFSDKETASNAYYFANTLNWDDVYFYTWDDKNVPTPWPGAKAELVETAQNGTKIYKAVVPEDMTKIIFNAGETGAQTVNIDLGASNFFTPTTSSGRTNYYKQPIYNVSNGNYTEPQKPTETTDPVSEPPVLKGDTNLDGKVNIKDATLIQKAAAKLVILSEKQKKAIGLAAGEEATVKDATKLQKFLAEIITEL